ncbi:MAG: ankyrin repeat domain-containing protein [Chlamydiales bacterium]|nr:ankyrin repeat domain-containing protein [Chlamydiales bacterium]
MSDGTQAWAEVWEGDITNGGKNNFPKQWVPDRNNPKGGHFTTPKFSRYSPEMKTFKENLLINRIHNTYEKSRQIPNYLSLDKGDLQGVSCKYGKILDLPIEEPGGTHTLYLPTSEVSEREAFQILREVARGIYVFRDLPFFSLHFNGSLTSYPVIPPSYRHTLVGEALGMLDYYMKGLENGRYFEKEFIDHWNLTREKSQQFLVRHAKDFHEYCENLGLNYHSFEEILKDLLGEEGAKVTSKHIYEINGQIIFHQNAIYKSGSSLSYAGGFDVTWELKGTPITEEEKTHDAYLREACQIMNAQIKELLPQLPICKKYFEILYLANFFSYYCNSLKEVNKIPLLSRDLSEEVEASCPNVFPPIPLEPANQLRLSFLALFESMDETQLGQVMGYLKRANSSQELKREAFDVLDQCIERRFGSFLSGETRNNLTEEVLEFCKSRYQLYSDDAKTILGPTYSRAASDSSVREKFFKELNRLIASSKGRDKKSWMATKEGIEKWFRNPLTACLENIGFLFNPLEGTFSILPDVSDECIHIGGGCGISIEDIEAQSSRFLGYFHRGTTVQVPYDAMEVIDGESPELIAKGLLFPPLPDSPLDDALLGVLDAISNEDLAGFTAISPKIKNWNFKDPFRVSLVHHASKCKDPSILQWLMEKGAKLNITDSQGLSPLHYAAMADSEECTNILLQSYPELLNLQGEEGQTPLFTAIQYQASHAIDALLAAGADPNLTIVNDLSPLLWAIQSEDEYSAMKLLACPTTDIRYDLNDKRSALEFAIEMKQTRVLKRLIECVASVNRDYWGYTPLHLAIMHHYVDGVKALLECKDTILVSRSPKGETPLELAQRLGHVEIVSILSKALNQRL